MHVNAVARARIDWQVGEIGAHDLRDPYRGIDLVDREHEGPRLVGPRRPQDIETAGIAIIYLRAEPPHEIDLLDARI